MADRERLEARKKFMTALRSHGRVEDLNLREVDLAGLKAKDVKLIRLDLRAGDLSNAELHEARIAHTDLRDASLRDAVILGGDLTNVDLRGANLRGAVFGGVIFKDVYLEGAYADERTVLPFSLEEAESRGVRVERRRGPGGRSVA